MIALPRLTLALVMAAATTPTLSAQSAAPLADPEFHFVASSGCGHVFLYAWNASRSEVLTAFIDKKKLALGPGTHVIDLAAGDGVAVGIDVYSGPNTAWVDVHGNPAPRLPYCNDFGWFARPAATWRAVAGTATLTIGKPGEELAPGSQPFMYKATVRLEGLTVIAPDGRRLGAPAPVVMSGTVGWVSG